MDAFNATNLSFILDGFWLTIRISALAIVFSIILGTVLAMVKQFCRGKLSIFRWLVTAYIELFRCTPVHLFHAARVELRRLCRGLHGLHLGGHGRDHPRRLQLHP